MAADLVELKTMIEAALPSTRDLVEFLAPPMAPPTTAKAPPPTEPPPAPSSAPPDDPEASR